MELLPGCGSGNIRFSDFQSSSDQSRYDIMGYGVCLPSKYVDALINNHDSVNL